ncbi:hypothetical protein PSTT_13747 [Puccinia striiformis]|uniref:Uncharacterized protein n=1 Tax=Puccinia striiformis TaxID=27350 RepID=A0A2S4UQB2_9BASI|nr:hypothetical protein PSTT_13747 [Puccinia striiformis]
MVKKLGIDCPDNTQIRGGNQKKNSHQASVKGRGGRWPIPG